MDKNSYAILRWDPPAEPTVAELWQRLEALVSSPPGLYDSGSDRAFARLLLDLRASLHLHECKSIPVTAHRSGFPIAASNTEPL